MSAHHERPTMNGPVFSLKNCQVGYEGEIILHNISLDISPGERVALIGKSGSGKSTLLKHLQTLAPNEIAFCPQSHGLVPILSAFHNIYMGDLHRHSFFYNLLNLIKPQKKVLQVVHEIAAKLGIEPTLFTSIDKLSGGQQQRVNIGRALIQNRKIFIGDEPTSSIDDYQSKDIVSLICQQHETVILALHDVELALNSCDRIIGIKDKQISLDAPSSSLNVSNLVSLYQ